MKAIYQLLNTIVVVTLIILGYTLAVILPAYLAIEVSEWFFLLYFLTIPLGIFFLFESSGGF